MRAEGLFYDVESACVAGEIGTTTDVCAVGFLVCRGLEEIV